MAEKSGKLTTNAQKPNSLVENGQNMANKLAKNVQRTGWKCQSATIENVGFGPIGYIRIAQIPRSASEGSGLLYILPCSGN
jgi:hypothetical protein